MISTERFEELVEEALASIPTLLASGRQPGSDWSMAAGRGYSTMRVGHAQAYECAAGGAACYGLVPDKITIFQADPAHVAPDDRRRGRCDARFT